MTTVVTLVALPASVLIFLGARALYRRVPFVLLSPLLIAPLVLALLLLFFDVPYATYMRGAQPLAKLLGPATVAFAIPLHKHFALLRKHATEILASVAAGALVSVATAVTLAQRVQLSTDTTLSLAAHSVTTPIAMDVATAIGGVPTLAAVFVIVTGLFGIVAGPLLIRWLRIRTPIARGALLGVGAHGCGTSKAFEFGSVEGTVASIAMVVAGGMTILLAPALLALR